MSSIRWGEIPAQCTRSKNLLYNNREKDTAVKINEVQSFSTSGSWAGLGASAVQNTKIEEAKEKYEKMKLRFYELQQLQQRDRENLLELQKRLE